MAVFDVEGNVISANSVLDGKSMITLGDSIVYFDDKSAGGETIKGYQGYLRDLGMTVTNVGVAGAAIAYHSGGYTDIVETAQNTDFSGYDYVMVAGGTNDFGDRKSPIGTLNSTPYDNTTVIGALQIIIEKIISDKKNCKIFLMTPLKRTDIPWNTPNSQGKTMGDYAEAIKTAAAYYSVPVLDFFNMSGLNDDNMSTLTRDGVHPNNAGYLFVSNKLVKFAETL